MLVVLCIGALFLAGASVAQDECEIPLFVKQNLTGANVMILADNSGSMNTIILHPDYDPTVTWTGDFNSGSTYYVAADGMYEPVDFDTGFATGPSASLINPDGGEKTRYPGNYMNWVYFHASDIQRNGIPQLTRIHVLKQVLSLFIKRSNQIDMGLTLFDAANESGKIVADCGADEATLQTIIDGISPTGATPLGGAAETILDYFSSSGAGAPIKEPCQYNFNIIVTDGLPYNDCGVSSYLQDADGDGNDGDCSEYLDDVTWYMANKDLRTDLDGKQDVVTYVVGFLLDNQMLKDAADNGRGLYYSAANSAQLAQSIEFAVQDILRRISAGSAVAVVSTERGTDDRLYRGKFMPIDWTGYLESYALPYTDGDPAVWEAGSIMSAAPTSSRVIYAAVGNGMYDFRSGSAADLKDAMQVATEAEAIDLINWGRGDPVTGLRDRQGWILGDIVHSTPVVVGAPRDFVIEESYQAFRAANEHRRRMVYVGANDGMIHAFDALNGSEVWAFVPEFALPKFAAMADSFYCHKYSCDQTVSVKDVLLGGSWRTVLIGGGREGGASLFALDITNPTSPSLLWQADLPNGKAFHSEVEIGSVAGRPVAVVGSGLDDVTGEAWIYAFDVADGTLHGSRLLSSSAISRNKATRPAMVDVDLDGQTDLVYIADYLGSLWRFEFGNDPSPTTWSKTELFQGVDPITADPVAAFGPDGDVYVYFGSGAYIADVDMSTTDQQYFFCVFDNHSRSTASKADLNNQTSTISDVSLDSGWYVSLWNEVGERVTEQAAVVAETVIFTSFSPNPDACVAGGTSYLYQMKYDDGGVPDVEGMSDPDDRVESLGEGIASHPVVDLTEGTVVVQSSDTSIDVAPIASIYQRLTVRSWQESYDHVAAVPPVQ